MKSLLDHPVASPKRHHRQLPRRPSSSPVWLVLALTLGVWAFCLYMHQAQPDQEISAKPIAEVQLGDRVPGTNPIEPEDLQFGRDVDPATWRRVALQGYLADGSLMEFEILRPVQWIRENRVEANGSVHMEFDELGFRGKAKVKEITECPPIRLGPGAPVTAVFRHYAQEVFDLETENGESIGVTGNHPIWSEERQEFVPARELKPGEQLRHLNGETRFLRLAKRKGGYVVHNLEVLGTHVYHVANSGLLVHNTGNRATGPCHVHFNKQVNRTPSPALKDSDYHPDAVRRRRKQWTEKFGKAPEVPKEIPVAITKANSPVWQRFQAFRGQTKTNGLGGRRRQYYEWDFTHGDIEVYDSRGFHLGTMDAVTGEMIKDAVDGRTITL